MIFTGYPAEKSTLQTQPYRSAELVNFRPDHSDTKIVFNNGHAKVIMLALGHGQALNEHHTPSDTFLLMMEGEMEFEMNGRKTMLKRGDAIDIPGNAPHSVTAKEDSRFLLVH